MTRLVFFKDGKHYLGFSCKGHSGYSDEGSDIVCAAVSAAVQMSAEYITSYFGEYAELYVDEKNAEITLRCKMCISEVDRQLSVLERFSRSISEQYPDYFNIEFTEV